MKTRGVWIFLLLAFGLGWLAQIVLIWMIGEAPEGLAALGGGILIAAVALMWPPAIGAFVARRWVERSGFSDAGLKWPARRYLLIAWFGPAVLALFALLLSLPIYPFDPSFSSLVEMAAQSGQELPTAPGILVLVQVIAALTLAVPINAIFAFGEEFGWRGYLLLRLVELLGFWPGVLSHGAIWGFWHAPIIYLIGYNYPGHNLLGVPMFIIFGVLAGVLFAWMQFASGSVITPTIAHASLNAVAGIPLVVLRDVDSAIAGAIHSPVGWIVLLVVIIVLVRRGAMPPAERRVSA